MGASSRQPLAKGRLHCEVESEGGLRQILAPWNRNHISFLEILQSQIYEVQRDLLNKGKEVTVTVIRNKLHGIEEEIIDPLKDKSLMQVYREHIKHIADLVGKEYAKGTSEKDSRRLSLHWKLS